MEIGEYVRTEDGYIEKIKIIVCNDYPIEELRNKIVLTDNSIIEKEDIVKHSKKLIDLIEEGDYVNKNLEVFRGRVASGTEKLLVRNYIIHGMALECVDIKSIVTKEQFKLVEYEV